MQIQVQRFCNKLSAGYEGQKPLSAKTVKNIHGILHSALKQAVLAGIIQRNPADNVKLPKVKKPDLKPLMDEDIGRFLEAIKGDRYERIFIFTLFSGMRQSEVLGLQWDDVDFDAGEVTVCRQLQRDREGGGYTFLDQTKNGKSRVVPLSQSVMQVLRDQKRQQAVWQLAAGDGWNNEHNLVFTDELGGHLKHVTVYKHFKHYVEEIGSKETRFHDLRHSCAIMELQAGCSVKSIQSQLGKWVCQGLFSIISTPRNRSIISRSTQKQPRHLLRSRDCIPNSFRFIRLFALLPDICLPRHIAI